MTGLCAIKNNAVIVQSYENLVWRHFCVTWYLPMYYKLLYHSNYYCLLSLGEIRVSQSYVILREVKVKWNWNTNNGKLCVTYLFQGVTFRVENNDLVIARILHGGMIDRQGLLHVGDIIKEVNGHEVGNNPKELQELLKNISGSVTLKILPSYRDTVIPQQVSSTFLTIMSKELLFGIFWISFLNKLTPHISLLKKLLVSKIKCLYASKHVSVTSSDLWWPSYNHTKLHWSVCAYNMTNVQVMFCGIQKHTEFNRGAWILWLFRKELVWWLLLTILLLL